MKKYLTCRLLGLMFVMVCAPALAQSPVWVIEKNGFRVYLGGTFHLLTGEDYPLPRGFDLAYDRAAVIVLETDIGALKNPAVSQRMMRELSYSDGRNLSHDLSAETYRKVESFFTDRGIPMSQIAGFRAGMVSMMMTIVELQRLGFAGVGVDEFFYDRAQTDGKERGQLESVDAQIAFLANMGKGREDVLLAYTLEDMTRLPRFWADLKAAWRAGDMAGLDAIANTPFRAGFPAIYEQLVVNRNNAWLPQIIRMLDSETVELVLVGAMHLAGDDGLLHQLALRGYRVEQIQ